MGLAVRKTFPGAAKGGWTPTAVRLLRRRVGATQEQFARILGVVASTVHRWEAGIVDPDRPAADKLARLHEVAALLDLGFRAQGRAEWFATPDPRLGGDRPMDLLALPSAVKRIRDYLASLRAGDFA